MSRTWCVRAQPYNSYPGNDVIDHILEITDKNIHVHCHKNGNYPSDTPYLHLFERFDTPGMVSGSLATFFTQFDGCLVLL